MICTFVHNGGIINYRKKGHSQLLNSIRISLQFIHYFFVWKEKKNAKIAEKSILFSFWVYKQAPLAASMTLMPTNPVRLNRIFVYGESRRAGQKGAIFITPFYICVVPRGFCWALNNLVLKNDI